MYIIQGELKPLQCSNCKSQQIANMVNQGVIRCLNCGREKKDQNSIQEIIRRETGGGTTIWTLEENPKPYREF